MQVFVKETLIAKGYFPADLSRTGNTAGVKYGFYRCVRRSGVGWGRGGEGAGGWLPIYGIVRRMCVPNSPLFQHCQVYDWPPFFNKKYMNDPIFLDSYVKGPIFLTTWYIHIFFAQRFFEVACSLGIQWTDCDICLTTSNKWVQKINGQYMNRSTFWMIKYMNGSVFSKARYMNGVGFEMLARTPVSQLPLRYPFRPPPPPPPTSQPEVRRVCNEYFHIQNWWDFMLIQSPWDGDR